MIDNELLEKIRAVVGPTGVITGTDVESRPASWFDASPCHAGAIARPASTAEVSRVLSLCFDADQTVVPVGGNTGVVEGTYAHSSDIMISTERMTAIESVDADGATITVQAGVPLEAVQNAALENDLLFAVDFGARGSATIGGAISTNAGGNAVIRYGMMREQILGLEAVLADGTIVSSMNRMLKNNAGYDLKQLFIGTEGTLGIVTRAVLRLRPITRSRNTAFVAVDLFKNIPTLLRHLERALGGTLSSFEVLWQDFYSAVLAEPGKHAAPLTRTYPYYVLIEACGANQEQDESIFEEALGNAMSKELVADAAIAQSSQQREAMWAIREDIEGVSTALGFPIYFDVSVSIADAEEYVRKVHDSLSRRWPETYRAATFGHLGDSNIHFILSTGSNDADEHSAVRDIVYSALQNYGGSISAEHGVGVEKRPYLGYSRSDIEVALMRHLKLSLDTKNILNPGKVIESHGSE